MNFDLSEEQVMLGRSVAAYLEKHWDQDRLSNGGTAARRALWQGMAADLGLLSVMVPESMGGMGGGMIDAMVVAQELGRHLALDSFVPTAVYAGTLFQAADATQALEGVGTGKMIVALAHAEPGQLSGARKVGTSVENGRLTGTKIMVAGAPLATHFIVSAQEDEQQTFSLFLLSADATGITRSDFTMIDGQAASELRFEGVAVGAETRLGAIGAGANLHLHAADMATIAHTAEAVGMMETLIRTTAAYITGRQQFGQPLSAFQALQHRMADMVLYLEDTRSLLYMALLTDPADTRAFERAVTGMKVKAAEALRFVSQQAVQLHGGMGITSELMVGHFFKRAMTVNESYGGPGFYRKRYEASLD